MKIFYSYFILLIAILCNQSLHSQNPKHKTNYKVVASYTQYITALGKGKGIIFKITISNKDKKTFSIDSLFVKNTSMKFSVKQTSNGYIIESNYLVNTPEPSLNNDRKVNKSKEIEDEIIVQHKFYPSSILINESGKKIKLRIENFSEIKQKINQ